MVQWLGFSTFTVRSLGSIPGWGTKILQASQPKIIYVAWQQHHNQSLKIKRTSWTIDNFVMSFLFFFNGNTSIKKKTERKLFPIYITNTGLPAMQETQETCVPSLGWEDPLEKDMATHLLLLGNPMHRGVSWATVCGVTKSWTQLSPHHHHHKYSVTHLTR